MDVTLAEIGEFGLIDRLTADLVRGPQVRVGPGDDGAVLAVDGSLVVSVDTYVEGVHFRGDWVTATDLGHRVIGGATADIEAMGAVPTAVVVALVAPKSTPLAWADAFMDGLTAECEQAQVSLVGGDLSSGPCVMVSVTACGQTAGRDPILRSGAHVGDAVAYRGRLGWAAAGWAVLSRGFRTPRAVVSAYQRPAVPYGAGAEAARWGATAMIDISDGLVADLAHVARASSVVIDIDTGRLDIPEPLTIVSQATARPALDFVLGGGEDHALVATFPWGGVPSQWNVIGRVDAAGSRDPGVTVDGDTWLGDPGWRHF